MHAITDDGDAVINGLPTSEAASMLKDVMEAAARCVSPPVIRQRGARRQLYLALLLVVSTASSSSGQRAYEAGTQAKEDALY